MKDIIKRILKIIGLYFIYLILTVIIFYITGMYIWTTKPTSLVLTRMLVFPIFLTIATVLFKFLVSKIKDC